jgi:hypothetical protein
MNRLAVVYFRPAPGFNGFHGERGWYLSNNLLREEDGLIAGPFATEKAALAHAARNP